MKRVIIFWDQSNFQITLEALMKRDLGGVKVFDYVGFAKALIGEDDLIKVLLACSVEERDTTAAGFFKNVDYHPYFSVRMFERKAITTADKVRRSPEKQVDVFLATQIVALAYENAYDIAYLVSGDEDFVPAIEIVQQKGKIVIAVSAQEALSKLLKRKADAFLLFDDNNDTRMKPYYYQGFVK